MSERILGLEGLTRAFGDFALGPLSLNVNRGEYRVLVGPSGCSKSMLLKTLSGFHRPQAGRVCIEGRDATLEPRSGEVSVWSSSGPRSFPTST